MLTTIAVILVVLWALGLIGGYAAGGLIHLLLVVALIVVVLRVLSGRRVL
ncbi:MAG: lmo0937 family membrane protein [Gemmatimonadota bacterium]